MNSSDLKVVTEIHEALTDESLSETLEAIMVTNPAVEVEKSLVGFLQHRLSKLQDNASFEEEVKNTIRARMSEATFPQLLRLLDLIQTNTNIATEKVLAPFISQQGKTLPETIREGEVAAKDSPEDKIYEETEDKKVLQSLHAVQAFLEAAKASKDRALETDFEEATLQDDDN